jgi:hypothetical protein
MHSTYCTLALLHENGSPPEWPGGHSSSSSRTAALGRLRPFGRGQRQAEIERVKRKRPENLDAYDLVLRAIPDVYPAMPDRAKKALPLLESALSLEPDYAAAHGFAAWCHEILFVRGGAREENRLGATRHAHAAIQNGRRGHSSSSPRRAAMGRGCVKTRSSEEAGE